MKRSIIFILIAYLLYPIGVISDEVSPSTLYETCSLVSQTCVEGAGSRVIDGISIYRDCWKTQNNYNCLTTATINKCDELQSTTACSLSSSSCSITLNGTCIQTQYIYSCSGAMADDDITYINDSNVVAYDAIEEICELTSNS